MKITTRRLQKIIGEEIRKAIKEAGVAVKGNPGGKRPDFRKKTSQEYHDEELADTVSPEEKPERSFLKKGYKGDFFKDKKGPPPSAAFKKGYKGDYWADDEAEEDDGLYWDDERDDGLYENKPLNDKMLRRLVADVIEEINLKKGPRPAEEDEDRTVVPTASADPVDDEPKRPNFHKTSMFDKTQAGRAKWEKMGAEAYAERTTAVPADGPVINPSKRLQIKPPRPDFTKKKKRAKLSLPKHRTGKPDFTKKGMSPEGAGTAKKRKRLKFKRDYGKLADEENREAHQAWADMPLQEKELRKLVADVIKEMSARKPKTRKRRK